MTDAFVCWWGVQGFCKLGVVYCSSHNKKKQVTQLIFIIRLSIATPQCLKHIW